jgi:hypothetical protein
MLWYLADGSFNEYLKSQIELQGEYYSGQKTTVSMVDSSSNTGVTTVNGLALKNFTLFQAKNVLDIDNIQIELSKTQDLHLITQVSKISINKLTLNVEQTSEQNNIKQLIEKITSKLASDYPQQYPEISAAIYAKNNPDLNAEQYSKNNPQAGPIIEHTVSKKSRGKAQAKILISTIKIKTLELNTIVNGSTNTLQKYNLNIETIGKSEGLAPNQLGGELLLNLLKLANE